jgi:hypothetical protein
MEHPDIASQYAASPQPRPDTPAHFDQASQSVSPESLADALASMFRSSATPPFSDLVGNLFGQSSPQQRADALNHLVQALGPLAATVGGAGVLGSLLGGLVQGSSAPRITPEQAAQIPSGEVSQLAARAEQHNPAIIDRLGSFYAQHPTVVKTLGATALAVALGHLRQRQH